MHTLNDTQKRHDNNNIQQEMTSFRQHTGVQFKEVNRHIWTRDCMVMNPGHFGK